MMTTFRYALCFLILILMIYYFKDDKEYNRVKNEIINSVMDKLKKVYSDDRKPRKDVMREIVTQLTYAYPKMFREYEGKGG